MQLLGKKAVVFGLGRSGMAAARALRAAGASVTAMDQGASARASAAADLLRLDIPVVESPEAGTSIMILSPGIPSSLDVVKLFKAQGGEVLSEVELAFRLSRGPWLAVTGTNGKTTTTAWIAAMFDAAQLPALVGGNIGTALADRVKEAKPGIWIVAEVSSFQLEETQGFHPKVAVITNLTPDHLDRYETMDEYAAAKAKIVAQQRSDDFLIIKAGDPRLENIAQTAASSVLKISASGKAGKGLWQQDGNIYADFGLGEELLLPVSSLSLRGPHNLENALCAAAAGLLAGLPQEAVVSALKTFKGVEHRLEFCGSIAGVGFVNDSKGTNVDSVAKALQSFEEPVHLILGGKDKGGDFTQLESLIKKRVASICLIGEAAEKIAGQLKEIKKCLRADSLEQAVAQLQKVAKKGEWVLLSPGCASFDMFDNYEHRGRVFKQAVTLLSEGNKR